MPHTAGFVNILGKPNVGKSSLLNRLLGEKLSIITSKAQTTRHRILGILNREDSQVIFSDTPGIISTAYKLHEKMMGYVEESLKDADIFLYVVDATDKHIVQADNPTHLKVQEKLQKSARTCIIAINKVDKISQEQLELLGPVLHDLFPKAILVPVSAETGFNCDTLLRIILEELPEHPPYFDKEHISDRPVRFFVSEMIRETILEEYQAEIPYSVEVLVEEYKEAPDIDRISVILFVSRDTQKSIIIGKNGLALKNLGIRSRKKLEQFLQKKVYLGIQVKVRDNWRNNDETLTKLGY